VRDARPRPRLEGVAQDAVPARAHDWQVVKATIATLVVALVVVIGLLIAPEIGVPLGGLTHAQASAAAREAIHAGSATERWALPGPFLFFRGGSTGAVSPGQRMVWAVSFSGTFPPASCGPVTSQPHQCPPPDHTVTVIVDYVSGAFIEANYGP
jgi:hypothetical protein